MEPTKSKRSMRKRRQYTPEFMAGAVRLVLDEGKSVMDVTRDLDLTRSALDGWVRQAKIDAGRGSPGALTTAEKEELSRLRRENREVRMEREILRPRTPGVRPESSARIRHRRLVSPR